MEHFSPLIRRDQLVFCADQEDSRFQQDLSIGGVPFYLKLRRIPRSNLNQYFRLQVTDETTVDYPWTLTIESAIVDQARQFETARLVVSNDLGTSYISQPTPHLLDWKRVEFSRFQPIDGGLKDRYLHISDSFRGDSIFKAYYWSTN